MELKKRELKSCKDETEIEMGFPLFVDKSVESVKLAVAADTGNCAELAQRKVKVTTGEGMSKE